MGWVRIPGWREAKRVVTGGKGLQASVERGSVERGEDTVAAVFGLGGRPRRRMEGVTMCFDQGRESRERISAAGWKEGGW